MKATCSWCHELSDLNLDELSDLNLDLNYCLFCGHRTGVPRSDCNCQQCWKPDNAAADANANQGGPIPLTAEQENAAKEWAADDRLWTTQETVAFNLRTFARVILALASRVSAPTEAGWQPIKTAPKDGTYVLLWVPNQGIYGAAIGCSLDSGEWDYSDRDDTPPTHWMPLPQPPALASPAPAPDGEKR